ncbi:hypothetical protein EH240_04535 [Mesorhizobium tamadayense]|uniref:Lytic murein transglycosylase n=1 Tax=Mesorhizobium tamadayense TaxID=425306 RepID=A0A3P3G4Z5_9HYPH|nr:hypothetical protein EH240_04535 [Mesorhizobium tamadayense]
MTAILATSAGQRPLCPAGHLPRLGGDWMSRRPSPISDVAEMSGTSKLPISPLVREMSGRTEGARRNEDVG